MFTWFLFIGIIRHKFTFQETWSFCIIYHLPGKLRDFPQREKDIYIFFLGAEGKTKDRRRERRIFLIFLLLYPCEGGVVLLGWSRWSEELWGKPRINTATGRASAMFKPLSSSFQQEFSSRYSTLKNFILLKWFRFYSI